ncbi:glycine oxidase ThiO [Streptomyces alkaliphilus]|uniref:glycine oxidase n=1 Tax=Streptomyces alkaliphilus TaxID=1472722 RepID=A0A7W3Y048_9ACTN|nr:glycine oxidase ThiO [Streptomyces alkaliphilus]
MPAKGGAVLVTSFRPPRPGVPGAGDGVRAGTPDVLVIGGGIIGLVVAWRAAERGLRVTVVDPEPGGGAARVAAGMLAAVTELHHGEEELLELNLASSARWPAFADELADAAGVGDGSALGYRRCGTLAVALDADDRAELRDLHALQTRCGLQARWLTGRECRRLEPMLAPGVRGGLRVEDDHQVDPRPVVDALLIAAERAGVVFVRREARGVWSRSGRVGGAVLADGARLAAGRVVVAAGSRGGRLEGLPEEARPPVRPVKGQVLRLRMPTGIPFLSRTVRAVVRGSHVYLVPRESGELVIGATSEEQGWDTTVTAGGVYELLRDAHELVPGLTELPLVEAVAGLRPGTPDNAPLLGGTGTPGLLIAGGHHRNGVLLAPITGDLMAEYLTTGTMPERGRPFSPERFAPVGAGVPGGPGASRVPHPIEEVL